MKFHKIVLNCIPVFLSDCGEYKAVNYGGVRLYHKDTFYDRKTKKKYRAFGNAVEHSHSNYHSKVYKSYRQAFRVAEEYKNAQKK